MLRFAFAISVAFIGFASTASAQYAGSYRSRYDAPNYDEMRAFDARPLLGKRAQIAQVPAQPMLIDAGTLAMIARQRAPFGGSQYKPFKGPCDKNLELPADLPDDASVVTFGACQAGRQRRK